MKDENVLKKKLVKLAFPLSLEGLLTASADFVDTLMVSSLGETAVSAVGLGTQLFFIQSMTIYGFSGGAATFLSQFYGSGNWKGIRKTLSITICTALSFSFLLFALVLAIPGPLLQIFTHYSAVAKIGASYMVYRSPCLLLYSIVLPLVMALKSTQHVKLPVFASIVAIVSNLGLNYILIFGKFGINAMGADGAGLATTISLLINLIILLGAMFVTKNPLLKDKKDYLCHGNRILAIEIFKNAVPTTFNEMMWSGGMAAYNAAYGRISVLASAVTQAADIVTHIFTKTIYSVGDATLIIIGELLGRGEKENAWHNARKLLRLNVFLGILAGILLIVLAYPVAGMFHFDEQGRRYLMSLLCIYGVSIPLKIYNITLITGILRAGGDVKFAMKTEVSAIWLISVPLVFMGALLWNLPIFVVVIFAQTEDFVKCVILTKRFYSRKWINNKVEKMQV